MKDSDTFTFFGEKTDITRKDLRDLVDKIVSKEIDIEALQKAYAKKNKAIP